MSAPRLRDRLCRRPRILLVGINPSLRSARVGHHFAGPGNPFYRLLHAAGLAPVALTWADDVRLPAYGLALTNIVARPTRAAADLAPRELRAGRGRLLAKVRRLRPAIVAFVGVTVYRAVAGANATPGCGAKPGRLAGARIFVLPNPSGLNAAYPGFADKLVWYRALARFARRAVAQKPSGRSSTAGAASSPPRSTVRGS